MKRRFRIKAVSANTTALVSVLVKTNNAFTRSEAETRARDIVDELITAMGKRFRPSRVEVN